MRTTKGINFHGFQSFSSVFGGFSISCKACLKLKLQILSVLFCGFSNPISCKACLKLKAPFPGRASPSRSRFKRRRTNEGSTSPMLTMSGELKKMSSNHYQQKQKTSYKSYFAGYIQYILLFQDTFDG